MTYDSGRHHRRSVRLPNYDYAQAGVYFVTLCTLGRVPHFDNAEVRELASDAWQAIPQHALGVSLDEWVAMPNHLHGLLLLSTEATGASVDSNNAAESKVKRLSPRSRTLSVIIRTYKAAVTTACRRAGYTAFAWQSSFYEHVVRDATELDLIRTYIRNNPLKWALDHDNPDNHGQNPSTTPWVP